MKTFIITIEIEHTDKSFASEEIQSFIEEVGSPRANFVKSMRKAFKDTTLGDKAHSINVTYALKE
jgi:hypothetical protein